VRNVPAGAGLPGCRWRHAGAGGEACCCRPEPVCEISAELSDDFCVDGGWERGTAGMRIRKFAALMRLLDKKDPSYRS